MKPSKKWILLCLGVLLETTPGWSQTINLSIINADFPSGVQGGTTPTIGACNVLLSYIKEGEQQKNFLSYALPPKGVDKEKTDKIFAGVYSNLRVKCKDVPLQNGLQTIEISCLKPSDATLTINNALNFFILQGPAPVTQAGIFNTTDTNTVLTCSAGGKLIWN